MSFTAFLLSMIAAAPSPMPEHQLRCEPEYDFRARISTHYREEPLWLGAQRDGFVIVLFVKTDGTGWTVAKRGPDGTLCPLAAGTMWSGPALGEIAL